MTSSVSSSDCEYELQIFLTWFRKNKSRTSKCLAEDNEFCKTNSPEPRDYDSQRYFRRKEESIILTKRGRREKDIYSSERSSSLAIKDVKAKDTEPCRVNNRGQRAGPQDVLGAVLLANSCSKPSCDVKCRNPAGDEELFLMTRPFFLLE